MSNPRFAEERALEPSRFGGPSHDVSAEIAGLKAQVAAQATEIRELRRTLQSICDSLGYGRREPPFFQQVEKKLQSLADEIGRMQSRNERPAIIRGPVPPTLPRQVSQPVRNPPAAPPPRDFGGAIRTLIQVAGIADPEDFVQRIQNGASQQFSSSQSHIEAGIKAVFNLLPQAAPNLRHSDLEAFVTRALGPEAKLIVPVIGMAFDLSAHTDCSMSTTGSRDRVRECIFPGLRLNERVVVRASVRT